MWLSTTSNQFPALISLKEVLADQALRDLNSQIQIRINGVQSSIQEEVGLRRNSPTGPYQQFLSADAFLTLPVIFFGIWDGALSDHSGVAFTPDLANLLPATSALFVFPRQCGPRSSANQDVCEAATSATMGSQARYADDWDYYHTGHGEVHCGTAALRAFFTFKWWERMPNS